MKTPITKYSEKTTYKDENVEVLGEVFQDPIEFQNQPEIDMYTRVCIMCGPACLKKIYYPQQMDESDLKAVINTIKDNLDKYIK